MEGSNIELLTKQLNLLKSEHSTNVRSFFMPWQIDPFNSVYDEMPILALLQAHEKGGKNFSNAYSNFVNATLNKSDKVYFEGEQLNSESTKLDTALSNISKAVTVGTGVFTTVSGLLTKSPEEKQAALVAAQQAEQREQEKIEKEKKTSKMLIVTGLALVVVFGVLIFIKRRNN